MTDDYIYNPLEHQKRILIKKNEKYLLKEICVKKSSDDELFESYNYYSELLAFSLEQGFCYTLLQELRTKLEIVRSEILSRSLSGSLGSPLFFDDLEGYLTN